MVKQGDRKMDITTTTTGIYADGQRLNCEEDLNNIILHLKSRIGWHRENKPNMFDR